jgi:ribosome-associated protein
MTTDGFLVITARQFRTQDQNRQDARERLVELIRQAAKKPKARHKTKPPQASKERRLDKKKQRAGLKQLRRSVEL